MSTLNNFELEVTNLAERMTFSFGDANTIQQQLVKLQQQQKELIQIKADIQPNLAVLEIAIAKIDTARVAKAAAGVALMLIGGNSDNDDFFSSIFAEITTEIGNELLDQAIHDENSLRQYYQVLKVFAQRVEIIYEQCEQLQNIAQLCLKEPQIIEYLEDSTTFLTVEDLTEQFHQIINNLKLIFTFSKPQLLPSQLEPIKLTIQQLNQLQIQLQKFHQSFDNSPAFTINSTVLKALLRLFGNAVDSVEPDCRGQLVFTIGREQHTIINIYNYCQNLSEKIQKIFPLTTHLRQLTEQCINHPAIIKSLQSPKSAVSLSELESQVKELIDKTPPKLTFGDGELMERQANTFKQFQTHLREIQNQLDAATKLFANQEAFPLNASSIIALLDLFGSCFTGVGIEKDGNLVIYHNQEIIKFESFCKSFIQLKQNTKQPIIQTVYLGKIAEQCLNNAQLIQLLSEAKSVLSLADFKKQLKELAKRANPTLAIDNPRQIRQQTKEIIAVGEHLQQMQQNLVTIIKAADQQTGISLTPSTLTTLISLFGGITAIEFNRQGQLVLYLADKSEKLTTILKFCNKVKPQIEAIMQKSVQIKDVAENCLKDPSLRRKLEKKHYQRKLQLKAAIAASIMVLLSPVAGIGWMRYQQEQLQSQVQGMVSQIPDVNQMPDLITLQNSQAKLKEAISRLDTIPNLIGSAYQQAQVDAANLKNRLPKIEQRVQIEESAIASLAATQQPAMEAALLVQNPPHPLVVWQKAQGKWQEAINLLESIPEGTFVSTQAKTKLVTYRANYDVISKRLSTEEKINSNWETANKLGSDALQISQQSTQPLATWKQAQVDLQEAIKLLETTPKNTPFFVQSQEKLPIYRTAYTSISQKLTIEEKAEASLGEGEKLAKKALQIIEIPPYNVEILKIAQDKLREANQLLQNVSTESHAVIKAKELTKLYGEYLQKIQYRIGSIELCHRLEMSECSEQNTPLSLARSE